MDRSACVRFGKATGLASLCLVSCFAGLACSSSGGGGTHDAAVGTGGSSSSGGRSAAGAGGGGATATSSGGVIGTGGASGGASGGAAGAGTGGSGSGGKATGGATAGGAGGTGTSAGGARTGGSTAAGGTVGLGGSGTVGLGGSGTGSGGVGTGGTVIAGTGGAGTGGAGTGGTGVTDTVARTASTFKFQHFPIQANSDGVWSGSTTPGTQATSTTYDTIVLENAYLRVTLLPSYGGRVLSIFHKPTNREMLYQNPIGTPYLMGEDIFYYNYLVIMGGIFASFPEPEHGKYWNQPYTYKIVSETPQAITVRMSRQDDRNLATGVPSKYDVGRTDVLVEVDVTVRAGSTGVELATKLTNTQSKAVAKFEYWTVTTLAPGSASGKTAIPLNTRILAAMDKVHLLESSWTWFGSAEERVSGEVFKWKNLASFKNWVDQGTAFANPDYRANWSGLMNDDNATAILRVSENVKTPGLKLWTFGKQSLTADVNDSTEWLRPTIEMWHGVTPEFWSRGTMTANEVRQWSQTFFPTFGLKDVTAASEYGALSLSSTKGATDTVLTVAATLTIPDQTVKAVLRINGTAVAEQDVVVAAKDATTVSATVANGKVPAGAVFQAELLQGDKSLLSGQITLP